MQVLLAPSFYALFDWELVKISESVATSDKGEEHRADIVLEVPLLNSKFRVIMTIILSSRDEPHGSSPSQNPACGFPAQGSSIQAFASP